MARRDCPEAAAVGAEMLAAVRTGLATLHGLLTARDPKTALRAVAELTKLLSVCARHGIAIEAETEPTPVAAPVGPTPAPAVPEPPRCEPARPPRRPTRRDATRRTRHRRPDSPATRPVSVHTPAETRDGGVVPVLDASTASVSTASTSRFCWRQLATTVNTRSTNRLPGAPSVPPLIFRQHTA